jgi:hypothetical protein
MIFISIFVPMADDTAINGAKHKEATAIYQQKVKAIISPPRTANPASKTGPKDSEAVPFTY